MIVLAIDTCLSACSIAVLDGARILGEASEPMTRGQQERLPAMTREVARAAGVSMAGVERIGVTIGPGSFTGLRVGLAFAKGLAFALGRPCVGVGALQALAASVSDTGLRAAVIDAGRGHVFVQLFDAEQAIGAPDNLPLAIAAARLAEAGGQDGLVLVGPGAPLLAGVFAGARIVNLTAPAPAAVALLAASAAIVPPRPLYLRAPDARPKSGGG